MERSTCTRVTFSALCCMAFGVTLAALVGARVVPLEASLLGMPAILGSAGLLTWVGVQLWAAMRGKTVAYRVLYHADRQPDGRAIMRMLDALARNAGHVSLTWHLQPAKLQLTAVAAGAGPDGIAGTRGAGLPASEADQPRAQDGRAVAQSGHIDTSPANISLYIVAPVAVRKVLEGMLADLLPGVWAEKCAVPCLLKPPAPGWAVRAWRWDPASTGSGSLADPLACGAHLVELAAGLARMMSPAVSGTPTETGVVGALEVQLKLWPHGWSALVMAQCPSTLRPMSEHLSKLEPQSVPTPMAPNGIAGETSLGSLGSLGSPLPFLKPLRGWTWMWRPEPAQGQQAAGDKDKEIGGKRLAFPVSCTRKSAYHELAGPGLLQRLVSALAANYPLWEGPRKLRKTTVYRLGQARKRAPAAQVQMAISRDAISRGKREIMGDLLFPPTTGAYLTLDSIEAGEVSLPPSYLLPPVPSQIMVLGGATRGGRPVGLPALRKTQRTLQSASGVPSALAYSGGENTPNGHNVMRLHPMLAGHLLVAGGNDAWRRDIAGSLVSQALEMGMTVVAVDGGPPPDEPSPSARKASRIVSGDLRVRSAGLHLNDFAGATRAASVASAAGADPLSPTVLRSADPAMSKWVAQIDMDNPAGSVHPNMMYVSASPCFPPMQAEAIATTLALRFGLVAQMRFLRGMNVTSMDTRIESIVGIVDTNAAHLADAGAYRALGAGGAGISIMEAWLTVLLLRHHRARLLVASRGISSSLDNMGGPGAIHGSPSPASHVAAASPYLPSCPDLPALLVVMEQCEMLLNLLRRERAAWSDPEWASFLQGKSGIAGERALQAAMSALERAADVEHIDPHDMVLYSSALRGQLKRMVSHPAMMRMLNRPHVSLTDLLQGDAIRMLRVSLSGAYRTAIAPYSDDDLARKRYGLYLLWSLWAASQQRKTLSTWTSQGDTQANLGRTGYIEPDPVLLMLHGAGAWFGSGSPLSEPSGLQDLGHDGSGIALVATVSGLRHLRAHRARACEEFGNLVIGPAPVAEIDASDVTLRLVDHEMHLLRNGMHIVAEKAEKMQEAAPNAPLPLGDPRYEPVRQALDGDRLLGVLRRIEEGSALVVTHMPGGSKAICTARIGSGIAGDLRTSWTR